MGGNKFFFQNYGKDMCEKYFQFFCEHISSDIILWTILFIKTWTIFQESSTTRLQIKFDFAGNVFGTGASLKVSHLRKMFDRFGWSWILLIFYFHHFQFNADPSNPSSQEQDAVGTLSSVGTTANVVFSSAAGVSSKWRLQYSKIA